MTCQQNPSPFLAHKPLGKDSDRNKAFMSDHLGIVWIKRQKFTMLWITENSSCLPGKCTNKNSLKRSQDRAWCYSSSTNTSKLVFTMSWDTQPTIKELPFTLEIMLWHHSSFHWRSGQWQHRSHQGKVDVSMMFHLTQQAHSSHARHGALHLPCCPCLLAVPCLWNVGSHHASRNFEYSTVGEKDRLQPTWFARTSMETLSPVRNDRKNIFFDFECLPSI